MRNIFTKRTKAVTLRGSHKTSVIDIPANEDWVCTGVILSYNYTTGIVTWRKIWDPTASKTFYASAHYPGMTGKPVPAEVQVGSESKFYRVGAFNSLGTGSHPQLPELDTQTASKVSWRAFFFT